MVTLKAKERDQFWRSVEQLGTPRARLGGLTKRKGTSWLKPGLVARVKHLRGEDKLRHATVQAVAPEGELPGDVAAWHQDEV